MHQALIYLGPAHVAVVVFIPFIFTLHFSACLFCQTRKMLKVLFCTMDNGFPFSIRHTLLGREFDFDSSRVGNFRDFV
jgi:hypothetical protein